MQRGNAPRVAVARRILDWVSGLDGYEELALGESDEPAGFTGCDTRWIADWAGLGIEPWRPPGPTPRTDELAEPHRLADALHG